MSTRCVLAFIPVSVKPFVATGFTAHHLRKTDSVVSQTVILFCLTRPTMEIRCHRWDRPQTKGWFGDTIIFVRLFSLQIQPVRSGANLSLYEFRDSASASTYSACRISHKTRIYCSDGTNMRVLCTATRSICTATRSIARIACFSSAGVRPERLHAPVAAVRTWRCEQDRRAS